MQSKKKLIISLLVTLFVLLAVIASLAIVFAMSQQSITTTVKITYKVQNIDGSVRANYTIGNTTNKLTAMKNGQVLGENLIFKASDTQNAGSLEFPEGALNLTSQNDNVVIQYIYSNTGGKHYIASMSFDSNLKYENMKVEYSINGVDYSTQRFAVVVPSNTTNKSYWIRISIDKKEKSSSFSGDFKWLLEGCDDSLTNESYKALTSVDFQSTGTAGSYSVSLNGNGYLPEGKVVFPSSVNGNPVTTIAASSLSDAEKAQIKSVYIPNSVTRIESSAFAGFTNLENVIFENAAGWSAGTTSIAQEDLTNSSNAASLLNSTYSNVAWVRT